MTTIRCKNCRDVITSKHQHDWQKCSCWTDSEDNTGCYVDGGEEYTRIGGKLDDVEIYNQTLMTFVPLQWESE